MQNKPKKFIDFIITQKCTYNCEYCSQSKLQTKIKNNADKKTINAFFNLIKKLENDWEITITGGEAILHPDFYEIISEIKKLNFKVNLITNLSFDIKIYEKIFKLLSDNLNRYDISFHLDEIENFNTTIEKLENFIKLKPKNTKTVFLIPIYKLDKIKEEKINTIINIAKKYNINYDFQHIHYFDKYKNLSLSDKNYIKNKKPKKTFSTLCSAGKSSLVIYEDGEAYRCYSSRFLKSNSLGNIKNKNFKLVDKAIPCTLKYCTCPKPRLYGQIQSTKKPISAYLYSIKNIFYLPYMIIKKREIIIAKLKQMIN